MIDGVLVSLFFRSNQQNKLTAFDENIRIRFAEPIIDLICGRDINKYIELLALKKDWFLFLVKRQRMLYCNQHRNTIYTSNWHLISLPRSHFKLIIWIASHIFWNENNIHFLFVCVLHTQLISNNSVNFDKIQNNQLFYFVGILPLSWFR